MEDHEKNLFIFNELQRLTSIFHLLPGIHDPEAKLPRSEKDLVLPKGQFLRAFKYMAACEWMPDEGLELSLSAMEVKRRFRLETFGKHYDDSSWPKYAISFFFNSLISAKHIGEFFPDALAKSMRAVDRNDVFEWEQQRFDGLQDPNSPCRVIAESKDAVCEEILDFLASVEIFRGQGHDKYWSEVHKKLGMSPPPFASSGGCLALIVIGSLISVTLKSVIQCIT